MTTGATPPEKAREYPTSALDMHAQNWLQVLAFYKQLLHGVYITIYRITTVYISVYSVTTGAALTLGIRKDKLLERRYRGGIKLNPGKKV